MSMHQRRPVSCADICDRFGHCGVAGKRISAIDLGEVEVREVRHQPRDVAAGSINLDRRRDRVLVVFHDVQHRQLAIACGVQRLPELALARRTFADGDVHNLIAVEPDILVRAVIEGACRRLRLRSWMPREVTTSLGAAHRMQALRSRRRARRHNMQFLTRPVRRHLPSATRGVFRRADRLQELLLDRVAERQANRAVAIVRKEPVISGPQRHPRCDQQGLMSSA